MKIRIELINDYKHPSETLKAVESKSVWISEGEEIYDKLVKLLGKEIEDVKTK